MRKSCAAALTFTWPTSVYPDGTRVNGRPIARRVLDDGDVLTFGSARCRIEGLPSEEATAEAELRRSAAPELTRRELDVLISLCRPALSVDAFITPATPREIAGDLVVTEAAVKQHLLRLYAGSSGSGGDEPARPAGQ